MRIEQSNQDGMMVKFAAPGTFLVDLTDREIWWGINVINARGHRQGHGTLEEGMFYDPRDRPWRSRQGERANRDTDERE